MPGYKGPAFKKQEQKTFKKNPIFTKDHPETRGRQDRKAYQTALNPSRFELKLERPFVEEVPDPSERNYPIPYLKNHPSHTFEEAKEQMSYEAPIDTYERSRASSYEVPHLKHKPVIENQDKRSTSKTRLYEHADQNLHHLVKRLVKSNETLLLFE